MECRGPCPQGRPISSGRLLFMYSLCKLLIDGPANRAAHASAGLVFCWLMSVVCRRRSSVECRMCALHFQADAGSDRRPTLRSADR